MKPRFYKCNIDGTTEKLVAANNKQDAATKMNIPLKLFLRYGGHITTAPNDLHTISNNPTKIFKKEILSSQWIEDTP